MQQVIVFEHEQSNLFYIAVVKPSNADQLQKYYSRAKYIKDKIDTDEHVQGSSSGFIIALINTNYSGWEQTQTYDIDQDFEADQTKTDLIEELIDQGKIFAGFHKHFVKGVRGNGTKLHGWNKMWNVSSLKKSMIIDKINVIVLSLNSEEIPQKLFNDAYLAIVCPDTHGPRMKNFGSYQVDCLANLFRFIRHYLGKDLDLSVNVR